MFLFEQFFVQRYVDFCRKSLTFDYFCLQHDIRAIVTSPKYTLPFLQPGRLVRLAYLQDPSQSSTPVPPFDKGKVAADGQGKEKCVWGAVVNFEKVGHSVNEPAHEEEDQRDKGDAGYVVDILVNCKETPKMQSRGKGDNTL